MMFHTLSKKVAVFIGELDISAPSFRNKPTIEFTPSQCDFHDTVSDRQCICNPAQAAHIAVLKTLLESSETEKHGRVFLVEALSGYGKTTLLGPQWRRIQFSAETSEIGSDPFPPFPDPYSKCAPSPSSPFSSHRSTACCRRDHAHRHRKTPAFVRPAHLHL